MVVGSLGVPMQDLAVNQLVSGWKKKEKWLLFVWHGGAICRASRLQRSVATNAAEAEFLAASEATQIVTTHRPLEQRNT